jgi:hypothetical protein
MEFALCTFKPPKKGSRPKLALSIRRRHDTYTLVFNDGSYGTAWDGAVHPLTYLDALPIVDRIALMDASMTTFPILVRVLSGGALDRPGFRVMVGVDTIHSTRGLLLGTGWSGSFDMIERMFPSYEAAVAWTTDLLTTAAGKTSATLKLYFTHQTTNRVDPESYVGQLRLDGYLAAPKVKP